MVWIVISFWRQVANQFQQLCLVEIESWKGSAGSALQYVEGFFCSGVTEQWIGETVTG
jgi:hypothetical protein